MDTFAVRDVHVSKKHIILENIFSNDLNACFSMMSNDPCRQLLYEVCAHSSLVMFTLEDFCQTHQETPKSR